MSFNETHTISLHNYEEWFVLYMDNELNAAQQAMVESFVQAHPHLQEELDLLCSTKLPVEDMRFSGKEDLLANAMKLNVVDDSLLLYVDNELSAAEKMVVEEKIGSDQTYRLQYELLQQTKLDAAEIVPYPNKKELYRHTEKVIFFPMWIRIAVAIVLVLFATLFFVLNNNNTPVNDSLAVKDKPVDVQRPPLPSTKISEAVHPQQQVVASSATGTNNKASKAEGVKVKRATSLLPKQTDAQQTASLIHQTENTSLRKVEDINIDVQKLSAQQILTLNNPVANDRVTSATPVALNLTETLESIPTDGDFKGSKKTSAKGFLRKVSRFIERRTGIGTVNADNELLVGAVALKLN